MGVKTEIEETPEEIRERLHHEKMERLTEERAELLGAELQWRWPGGRMLFESVTACHVRMIYGVEVYSGSTPQSERWVAVELSASCSSWTEELSFVQIRPGLFTRTGRGVRGAGFYAPSVNLSIDQLRDSDVLTGDLTCSSGPSLNGGEGPGRMAMFTGCLEIGERVLQVVAPDSL